jgi:hypothetical protein
MPAGKEDEGRIRLSQIIKASIFRNVGCQRGGSYDSFLALSEKISEI